MILVVGNDARGVLFGVGRLLRALRHETGQVLAARAARPGLGPEVSAPRPSAWLSAQDQLLRRLGPAAVGAVHPRPGRLRHQRHRADPAPIRRRRRQPAFSAAAAGDDGRHVAGSAPITASTSGSGIPAMDRDYADPEARSTFALEEWGEVFAKLPRIDAVFVPGGDPGHTQPKFLMALLEKQAANLRRFHPKAQMWVSPQSFSQEWLDEFFALLRAEPAWLGGVVYGPQVRVSLPELRKAVPAKYPIRDYPDITHSLRCQYPVPDWDVAYCPDRRPRGDQSPPPRRVGDLSRVRRSDDRLHHLFRRLQRRRQQDRLERPGLGPGGRRARRPAATTAATWSVSATPCRRLRPGASSPWSRTGAGRCLTNGSVETTLEQFRALERRAPPRCWRTGGSSRRSIAPITTPTCAAG